MVLVLNDKNLFLFCVSVLCAQTCELLYLCMYNSLAHVHPLRFLKCVTNFPSKCWSVEGGVCFILLAMCAAECELISS